MLLKEQIENIANKQLTNLPKARGEVARNQVEKVSVTEGFATIITGLRRCGKSTLMRQLMRQYPPKEIFFVDFDDIQLTGFDVDDFVRLHSIIEERKARFLFFDEIQLISHWEVFVHQLLREGYLVYVTGSNASMLSVELGTHLTGRHISSELFPFSYAEYLKYTKQTDNKDVFVRYLYDGGMPEYLSTRDRRVLLSLLDDILIRDIAIRRNVRNVEPLKRLALYLLTNVAKPYSGNRLTSVVGNIATSTVLDYVDYFRDAYLIDTIGQYSTSIRTTIRNPKKVYAIDTGIAHSLTLSPTEEAGRLLENYQYLQLRRKAPGHIYYYRGEGECDFVVTDAANAPRELYQVCLQLTDENMKREIGGLREAMKTLHLAQGTIVTLSQEDLLNVDEGTIRIVKAR